MNRKKSIDLLNQAAADELHAVHQYMYFHFHLADLGYGPLSALFKRTAIEEMLHVEVLAERILFLKGDVEMFPAAPVQKITDPQKMLLKASQMEDESAAFYNKAANDCAQNRDSQSKQLFEQLVADEERHFDQYDKQLDHLKKFGDRYLALQSFGGAAEGGPGAPPEKA
jgi:bacterioferritin